jgi:hypothetical protein
MADDVRWFTPGPWRVGEDASDGYLYSLHVYAGPADDWENVAWASCSQDGAQSGENAPRLVAARANARLIAAAPELLAAAREALHRLDHHMGDTDPSDDQDPDLLACQALSAAISRATSPEER